MSRSRCSADAFDAISRDSGKPNAEVVKKVQNSRRSARSDKHALTAVRSILGDSHCRGPVRCQPNQISQGVAGHEESTGLSRAAIRWLCNPISATTLRVRNQIICHLVAWLERRQRLPSRRCDDHAPHIADFHYLAPYLVPIGVMIGKAGSRHRKESAKRCMNRDNTIDSSCGAVGPRPAISSKASICRPRRICGNLEPSLPMVHPTGEGGYPTDIVCVVFLIVSFRALAAKLPMASLRPAELATGRHRAIHVHLVDRYRAR